MKPSVFRVYLGSEYPDPLSEFRSEMVSKIAVAECCAEVASNRSSGETLEGPSQKTWSDVAKSQSRLISSEASLAERPVKIARPRTCCSFCLKNGEPAEVFSSHSLYTRNNTVSCPKLRSFRCYICGCAGGDYAHTRKYCPLLNNRRRPRDLRRDKSE